MHENFDLPRRHVRVDRAFRALANKPFYGQHILATNALGRRKNLCSIRVKYDLQQALAVAEVNEDHATVVPSPVDPATDRDFASDQRRINLSAIMATHGAFSGQDALKKRGGMVRLEAL